MPKLVLLAMGGVLIGQVESLSGGGGWVGAGLLGLVLSWLLLKHLPEKDRQIRELVTEHLKAEKEQRTEYRLSLDSLVAHNKEQVAGLANALKEDLDTLRGTLAELTTAIRSKRV